MTSQNIIVLETNTTEQINVFKSLAKALKVKFEVKEKPYSNEFIEKINKSEEEIKQGKTTRVKKEDFKTFLEL